MNGDSLSLFLLLVLAPRYGRIDTNDVQIYLLRAIHVRATKEHVCLLAYVCAGAFKEDLESWADHHKSLFLLRNYLKENSTYVLRFCFDSVQFS